MATITETQNELQCRALRLSDQIDYESFLAMDDEDLVIMGLKYG